MELLSYAEMRDAVEKLGYHKSCIIKEVHRVNRIVDLLDYDETCKALSDVIFQINMVIEVKEQKTTRYFILMTRIKRIVELLERMYELLLTQIKENDFNLSINKDGLKSIYASRKDNYQGHKDMIEISLFDFKK